MTQTQRRQTPSLAPTRPEAQPQPSAQMADLPSPPTVCVIDDDTSIRETLRFLLEDAGYRVIEAGDGLTGYALLKQIAGRLIVLVDHKLPQMDGCDLLQLAANDEDLRSRHVFIFVTASPQRAEDDCGETIEELDATLIPKPFDIDDVLDAVAEAAARPA